MKGKDNINPNHYTYGRYECIEVLEDILRGVEGVEAFCIGNAVKYLWRYQRKNGTEDLQKAVWYISRAIQVRDAREESEEAEELKDLLSEYQPVEPDYHWDGAPVARADGHHRVDCITLDARIKQGKRPLTAFDELESNLIGTDCYFSDYARDYGDLSKCQIGTLLRRDGTTGVFNATKNNSFAFFEYCLPCEWVQKQKEPENKWRPFSINEWKHYYGVGYGITFRLKNSDTSRECMCCGLLSDNDDNLPGKGVINLGGELFVLQNLFDRFELLKNGKWQPFGVAEENRK